MNWINIKKELPKYYEPVLIICKNKHQVVCWRHSDGEKDNYTILDTDNIVIYTITHWQHLPKAPN